MPLDLDAVLARVAVGCAEDQNDDFVDQSIALSGVGPPRPEVTVEERIGRALRGPVPAADDQAIGNGQAGGSRYPNDRNRALAGGRGNRGNRIGGVVHGGRLSHNPSLRSSDAAVY